MEGKGAVVGKKAPEFNLEDQDGNPVSLGSLTNKGPLLIVFYPGDFTPVCTAQLCNYRDQKDGFENLGIQVVGISRNPPDSHKRFRQQYQIPFPLLSDPKNLVARAFGCQSFLMFGMVSRAVFILNSEGVILYRYVEPTAITRRKADELVGVIQDLKNQKLL